MKKMLKAYFGYWPIPIYYTAFIGLIYYTISNGSLQQYFYLAIIPLLLQPFGEWYIHKYLLHAHIPKEPGWKRNFMKHIHYDGHSDPSIPELLFAPPYVVFIGLVLGFFVSWLVCFSLVKGTVVFMGMLSAYLYYEWVHLSHHVQYKPLTAYGRKMRKAHLWHHFKNENHWWGITSPIADLLLGTFPDPKSIDKSETVRSLEDKVPQEIEDNNQLSIGK